MSNADNPVSTPPAETGDEPAPGPPPGAAPPYGVPAGPPPPGQPPPAAPYVVYAYPMRPPYNGLAIASIAVSCGAIAVCGLLSIVGAILGHMARKQIRETGEQGDGLALAGIIVGYAVTGLSLLLIVAYFGFIFFMISTGNMGGP